MRVLFLCVTTALLLSASIGSAVPITNGLVAAYEFSGNADDSSGNGNHGVVNGATLTADRFGNADAAYGFDGEGDFIELGSAISGFAEFSQFVWINPGSAVWHGESRVTQFGVGSIFLETVLEDLIFNVQADRDGGNGNGASPSSRSYQQFSASLLDPGWNSLALVGYSDDSLAAFVNGTQVPLGAATLDGGQLGNYEIPLIGAARNSQDTSGTTYGFFSGSIDDVYVFDRALSEAEIQTLHSFVPEPSTALLLGLGLSALAVRRGE